MISQSDLERKIEECREKVNGIMSSFSLPSLRNLDGEGDLDGHTLRSILSSLKILAQYKTLSELHAEYFQSSGVEDEEIAKSLNEYEDAMIGIIEHYL